MTAHRFRRRWYLFLLAALVVANIFLRWPSGKANHETFPPPPGVNGNGPGGEFEEKIQAALQKLPVEQRTAIEERRNADRQFFETLGNIPPEERRKKIEAYFAKNPPPQIPGLEFPPPPGANSDHAGGPGDPGNGGPENGHIPAPDVRRGLDQGIVNSLRKGNNP